MLTQLTLEYLEHHLRLDLIELFQRRLECRAILERGAHQQLLQLVGGMPHQDFRILEFPCVVGYAHVNLLGIHLHRFERGGGFRSVACRQLLARERRHGVRKLRI